MRHGKRGTRSKPQVTPIIIQVQPGQKLLWRDRRAEGHGFELQLVDAAVMQ